MTIYEGLTIALIATASVTWVQHWRSQKRIARQCVALSNLHECLKLVNMLQRHRDIALNQHNAVLTQSQQALKSSITQSIQALAMEPEIAELERWLSILDHWQRLQRHTDSLSPQSCYEQHNNLIENLLMLLEEVAEQAGFTKQQFADLPNIHLMWRELPWMLEYLSQARLVGAIDQHHPVNDADLALQLRGLDKQIRRLSRVTFDRVRYNGPHDDDKTRLVDLSIRQCTAFTASLQQQLQHPQRGEGHKIQVLRLGTSSVDATQQLLEREMRALGQLVQQG